MDATDLHGFYFCGNLGYPCHLCFGKLILQSEIVDFDIYPLKANSKKSEWQNNCGKMIKNF